MKRLKELWNKKNWQLIVVLVCVLVIIIGLLTTGGSDDEEVTYRETKAEYGSLVVGVTESGSVDIGTVEQTFDLDMSALQRASTSSSSSSSQSGGSSQMGGGMMGGMDMGGGLTAFTQIFSMGGSSSQNSGDDSSLEVEEVLISVGQQVAEGDALYTLNAESVAELEEELKSNVEKAKADLDAVYADQTLSRQTAEYTLQTSNAYGDYANTEYNTTVQTLKDAVTDAQESLQKAQETLAEYEAQLAETTASYEDALQVLSNCEWSRDNVDKYDNPYLYTEYFTMAQTAQQTVDTLEQKKEQLESNIEKAEQNVETATKSYASAQRNYDQGLLSAKQTLALRQLAYDTAQETYDITIAYLEDEASSQEETYAEAQEKWDEFDSYISDNAVCSQYNGIITSVELEEGDSIQTGAALVTLYDMDEVSITVTIDEEDMEDIAEGTEANLTLTAYPDIIFKASVTEISDASTDSDGNVTYDVTATIQGDVTKLFQGMTGEITFITKEMEEVLYVSNRAIIREGTKSYVKVKNEKGKIEKKEVTTGFSDGVNVEIVEGLSEGETVLIESKVSES